MSSDLSIPGLLELVHRYFPRNLYGGEPGYDESEENRRLLDAREEALENSGHWRRFLSRLEETLPGCRVEDWSVLFSDDNCWRVRVYLPDVLEIPGGQEHRAVVVLVSILAPVYVLYSSFHQRIDEKWRPPKTFYEDIPETKPYVDKVEAIVRDVLRVQRLPNETLFTPVPDIQVRNTSLGDAKLIDCLFTDDRW